MPFDRWFSPVTADLGDAHVVEVPKSRRESATFVVLFGHFRIVKAALLRSLLQRSANQIVTKPIIVEWGAGLGKKGCEMLKNGIFVLLTDFFLLFLAGIQKKIYFCTR